MTAETVIQRMARETGVPEEHIKRTADKYLESLKTLEQHPDRVGRAWEAQQRYGVASPKKLTKQTNI